MSELTPCERLYESPQKTKPYVTHLVTTNMLYESPYMYLCPYHHSSICFRLVFLNLADYINLIYFRLPDGVLWNPLD